MQTPPSGYTATPTGPGTGDPAAVDDGHFTAAEREFLAGSPPPTWATVEAVKSSFAGVDEMTVFNLVPSRSKARDAAAVLIRKARRQDGLRARNLRDAWEEPVAIVTMHGDQSLAVAERVAPEDLESMLDDAHA